ncbi:MAG: glycosyltransferase family 9 protein [Actinomycetes bacterium]
MTEAARRPLPTQTGAAAGGPPPGPSTVLVLRALGMGDLLTGVPALRAVRAHYPRARLLLAAPTWLAPLVRLVGCVDEIVPHDGVAALPWPWDPPEVAVNLHGRGPQSHRLLQAVRPGRMLAFASPDADFTDGPQWLPDEHEVERWCRMLAAYDIASDPDDLLIQRPGAAPDQRGVVVIHPGASVASRRWSAARFGVVAADLAARGHRVVVTGSPAEEALARQVVTAAKLPRAALLAGRLSLLQLASVVSGAALVISSDTGIAHLATALRTPSVTVFGPVPPSQWGARIDTGIHRALWVPDADGVGQLARVQPSYVVREALALLRSRRLATR